MIASSDGVVALITGDLSYGTVQEIVYAKILNRIVYIICTNGHHNHPWIRYHSTKVFQTLEEFETFIKKEK